MPASSTLGSRAIPTAAPTWTSSPTAYANHWRSWAQPHRPSPAEPRVSRGPLALDASPRDEPVHLSDSRPETHQHCSPADANCCQSLLLDPNATIGIDLHKRLFLLVTGRGEWPPVFPYHGCALPTAQGASIRCTGWTLILLL